jgi:hypothetical protein
VLCFVLDRNRSLKPNPALNSGHPFSNVNGTTDDRYWSATPGSTEPPWSVNFGNNGLVTFGGCGSGDGRAWCGVCEVARVCILSDLFDGAGRG